MATLTNKLLIPSWYPPAVKKRPYQNAEDQEQEKVIIEKLRIHQIESMSECTDQHASK